MLKHPVSPRLPLFPDLTLPALNLSRRAAGEGGGEGARADQGGVAEGQEVGDGFPEPAERAQRGRGVDVGGRQGQLGGGRRLRGHRAGVRAGQDLQRVHQGEINIYLW